MKEIFSKLLLKLKNHKFKRNTKVVFLLVCFISIFNILGIISMDFADWYRRYVFKYTSVIFSRISGLFTVSIGEIMICIALIIILLLIIVIILGFIKNETLKKIRSIYLRIIVYILVFVYAAETFNCFILYHTNSIEEIIIDKYGSEENKNGGKADDEERLIKAYNEIIKNLNELSVKLKRDENGDLIEDFTYDECKKALRDISDTFECLKGYYPNPKKIHFSNIMSQQYLAGIYFPFSMEANYNSLMYCANNPSVICHELSHLKGYIREDEANFIAFMACINSDNDFIKYSGYLQVFWYMWEDVELYVSEERFVELLSENEYVMHDDIFLKEEVFEEIEENAIISTETLEEATDTFIDTNLKLNGVESGYDNYSEVVKLIVLYYDYIDEIY